MLRHFRDRNCRLKNRNNGKEKRDIKGTREIKGKREI
jgi:hypothetical protein